MQQIEHIFSLLFLSPIVNLLVLILHGLDFLHIPGALGFSIFSLTVLIRLVLYPLTSSQLRATQKMQSLTPKLNELKSTHKGDSQRLQMETMKLYKEHGVNPAAGCIPTLLQIPIIFGLYQSIFILFNPKSHLQDINKLLYPFVPVLKHMPDAQFLGLNLADKPSQFAQHGWYLLLIPVITAVLQLIQSKMMAPTPVKPYPSDSPKEKKQKSDTEEAMSMVQTQMTYMMPLLIGYISWNFPIGVAVYWNTFTIFGILQQYQLQGTGGLAQWKDTINAWTKNKKK